MKLLTVKEIAKLLKIKYPPKPGELETAVGKRLIIKN